MAMDRRQTLVICAGLAILVCIVFGSVVSHPFIGIDDPDYISRNPLVQKGLTAEGIRWAFTSLRPFYWHPLTWLSLMLDCTLFGLRPGLHLLVNVFIHLLATLLLFRLLQETTGATWRSALVAALWAVHPLRVESVGWVAERKDVLSTFFFIATIYAHAHYARRPDLRRYLLMFAAFTLAVMSKPMAVSIPAALLVFDFWPLRRLSLADRGWIRPLLWGLLALDRGIPRPQMEVTATSADGEQRRVGEVTSGTFSPTLRQGIGLALLDRSVAADDVVSVDVRGRTSAMRVVKPPFVADHVRMVL